MSPADWPRAVIFDLDGTLVDSVGDIADVLNRALEEAGLPPVPESHVRGMIGSGARVLVERALAHLGQASGEALASALHHRFEDIYLGVGAGRSRVFPGGMEMLHRLEASGRRLAICTNKPQHVTVGVLDGLGVSACFASVVGARADLPRKPAPDMLLAAIQDLGVPPPDCVMVGDSDVDHATARAAGVAIVLVRHGYTAVPVDDLGADAVIDQLGDLEAVLDDVSRRRPGSAR